MFLLLLIPSNVFLEEMGDENPHEATDHKERRKAELRDRIKHLKERKGDIV